MPMPPDEQADQSRRRQNAVKDVEKGQGSAQEARERAFRVGTALEVETAVLSALYLTPKECFPIFTERGGQADFFFNPINRQFYFELVEFHAAHGHLDPTLFVQHLADTDRFEKLGGARFLAGIISVGVPPSTFSWHLDMLRDKYVAREISRASSAMAERVGTLSEDELWREVSNLEQKLADLRNLATDKLEGVENFSYQDLVNFDPKKDPNMLIGRRWLCRGFTCLWAAAAGAGKSTLEMQLAIYWGSGQSCFGITPVRPLRSLIVQAENDLGDTGEQLQGVMAGVKATGDMELNGAVERMVVVTRLIGVVGSAFLSTLRALIKLHKPDLVWIDPLFAFAGCNLMDAKEVGLFMREGLIPLAIESGTCIHVIHHAGKSSQDSKSKSHWAEIDYQYLGFGSSEIQNSFRAVNVIVPVSGAENTFRLILSKRGSKAGAKDLEGEFSNSIYLTHSKEGQCWLQIEQPEDQSKTKSDRQLQTAFDPKIVLDEMSVLEGWAAKDLQLRMRSETGMAEKTFYRIWAKLKEAGKIRMDSDRKWFLKTDQKT